MKTLEETKKGLEICYHSVGCDECPYRYKPWTDGGRCVDGLQSDALAHIEQLEAQIPRWIPVEEQLPPDGIADYLVTIKQKYPHETEWEYYTDKATYGGSYIDGLWDTEYDWIEGQETHITHWMPMPEPQKGGS